MATSNGQAFLALIESDLLTAAGQPLLSFLTAFGAAGGDPIKVTLAWVKLQGDLLGGLPGLESQLAVQIAQALTTKIEAALAPK
jgi:hypothetical protein